MDDESTQALTQQVVDPRRLGKSNSGLREEDISDVICILSPCSPAAFQIIRRTAQERPQHVLQNTGLIHQPDNDGNDIDIEEEETFIVNSADPSQAQELAFRFSSQTVDPVMGFCFGRNPLYNDVVVDVDTAKRVSNRHFRVYINNYGTLMIQDTSRNGTMVDGHLLRGKMGGHSMRTLTPGCIVQVISPRPEEDIRFVVRIPARDGYETKYSRNFQAYRLRVAQTERRQLAGEGGQNFPTDGHTPNAIPVINDTRPPMSNANFGMHWNGGDQYNVIGTLGRGAFATVYHISTTYDGQPLAAKELEKKRFIKNGRLDLRLDNEMRIMKGLSHPNIVQYIDYVDQGQYIYIIMEYVPCGDLQCLLSEKGVLTENMARDMALQILDALMYLHKRKITHRDIKPDNILIASTDPFVVKLTDFGLSKVVNDNDTFLKTFCGTLLYCAPEVFPHYGTHMSNKKGKRRRTGQAAHPVFHSYSQSVDIWSFAAVLWFSLCNKPPFEGVVDQTGKGMFNKIMETPLDVNPLKERGISDQAIDFLSKMLNTDPASRPSELECLQHPWLASEKAKLLSTSSALGAIAEEIEDCDEEPSDALSQLSINDNTPSGEASEIDADEVQLDSEDFDFLDPRQSKRIKADSFAANPEVRLEQSQENIVYPDLRNETSDLVAASQKLQRNQNRLFGEIGHSALRSSSPMVGEEETSVADPSIVDAAQIVTYPASFSNSQSGDSSRVPPTEATEYAESDFQGAKAASSLLGTESMVRELNMASPQSANSPSAAEVNEPRTPNEHEQPNSHPLSGNGNANSQLTSEEDTPKAPTFSRQFSLPITPSFFYDPYDPSTHNLEYASRVSGHDFTAAEANNTRGALIPLPDTMDPGKNPDPASSDTITEMQHAAEAAVTMSSGSSQVTSADRGGSDDFLRPPHRWGKLTSSPDSFASIVLRLENRKTTWGRNPQNTIIYPHPTDTRIAKVALGICFFGPRIRDEEAKGSDLTKIKGLHTLVTTGARGGIWVNGTHLPGQAPDGTFYAGRIYTGDVIRVCQNPLLEFVCELHVGEGAERRPIDEEGKMAAFAYGREHDLAVHLK